MSTLAACPFCGAKSLVSAFPTGNVNISCDECSVVMFGGANPPDTMRQMVAKWNARHGAEYRVGERVGRLVRITDGRAQLDLGNGVELYCDVEDLEAVE